MNDGAYPKKKMNITGFHTDLNGQIKVRLAEWMGGPCIIIIPGQSLEDLRQWHEAIGTFLKVNGGDSSHPLTPTGACGTDGVVSPSGALECRDLTIQREINDLRADLAQQRDEFDAERRLMQESLTSLSRSLEMISNVARSNTSHS